MSDTPKKEKPFNPFAEGSPASETESGDEFDAPVGKGERRKEDKRVPGILRKPNESNRAETPNRPETRTPEEKGDMEAKEGSAMARECLLILIGL